MGVQPHPRKPHTWKVVHMAHRTVFSDSELNIYDVFDYLHASGVADYTRGFDSYEEERRAYDMYDCVPGIIVDGTRFTITSKRHYFEGLYEKFEELADRARLMVLSGFASTEAIDLARDIRDVCDDRFGDYIIEDGEVIPFDEWVRRHEDGYSIDLPYACDYHF